MQNFSLRRLRKEDASCLCQFRLFALQESPHCFGITFAEEKQKSVTELQNEIQSHFLYGAWQADTLIGLIGGYVNPLLQLRHKVNIYGAYVLPAYRRQGAMSLLLELFLKDMAASYEIALASVVSTNKPAIDCFNRHRFSTFGTEPNAMKTIGGYVNLLLLCRELHQP